MICLVMVSPSIVTDPMPGMLIGWGGVGLKVRTTPMVSPAFRMPPRTCSGLTTRLICSMPFGTGTASCRSDSGIDEATRQEDLTGDQIDGCGLALDLGEVVTAWSGTALAGTWVSWTLVPRFSARVPLVMGLTTT